MDKEQLETFKTKLSLAIENHLARGGTLISGSFGFGKRLCPIACLVDNLVVDRDSSTKYQIALSEKLGFEVSPSEMWDFIGAFDDEDKLTINEVMVIGIELRKKYLTHSNE
jgi:hypothetical protein